MRPVAESIKRFGWGAVILARLANRVVIAGDTRFQAAELLAGIWKSASAKARAKWHPEAVRTATAGEVPVRFIDCTEREAHLLAIADNKVGEIAEWEDEQLALLLRDASLEDARVAGFESDELDKLLGALEEEDAGGDTGPTLGTSLKYQVLIECEDEDHQTQLLEQLQAEGHTAKALVT